MFRLNCSYGTGIYVGDTALLSGATKLLGKTVYNPLCFLQFEDPTLPPIHWDNVKLKFINLTSAIASVAFVNTFDFCSWTGNSKPFFEPEKFFLEWNFVTFENNRNYFYNDSMNNRISVQSLSYVYSANLSTPYGSANASASIFPGESFQASSQCCDELGTHTVCILEVSKLGTILAHVYYAISFEE
jgi:hypothetical protein